MISNINEEKIEKIRSDIIQYVTGGELSRELIFQIERLKTINPEISEILILLHSEYTTQSKKDKKMLSKMINELLVLDFRSSQAIQSLENELQKMLNTIDEHNKSCILRYNELSEKILNAAHNINTIQSNVELKVNESKIKHESNPIMDKIFNSINLYKTPAILIGSAILLLFSIYVINPDAMSTMTKDAVSIIKAFKSDSGGSHENN